MYRDKFQSSEKIQLTRYVQDPHNDLIVFEEVELYNKNEQKHQ